MPRKSCVSKSEPCHLREVVLKRLESRIIRIFLPKDMHLLECLNTVSETLGTHGRTGIWIYLECISRSPPAETGIIFLHRDEQDFMNRISRFIEDNLSNPQLNAAMIAQEIGVSERGIYRKIESITEKTLHQLIKESRIELATKLLTSSKLTIDEVMFKVGYENRSTFHRNFREAMGMAPKEYRQKVKNKALQTLTDTD